MSKKRKQDNNIRSKYKRFLKMSNIPLWLDAYDDIFSDFDSRPYSQRALSDDFLAEAKRASRDKVSGKIELQLLMPNKKRDKKLEDLIKRRLRGHFTKHFKMLSNEKKKIVNLGLSFFTVSIFIMFFTTLILFRYQQTSMFFTFLSVLLEPAGWFLFWEGLNTTIFGSKELDSDLAFYKKMTNCEVTFWSY